MLFLDVNCGTIEPLLRLIRFGVIPLIQGGIIIVLMVLLILDLGKAVMAGKEDEIKSAQKLAIKRVIYAVAVFFVPIIVNLIFGLLDTAGGTVGSDSNKTESTWISCYNNLQK